MHDDMVFEWDEKKSVINTLKHGISFAKAREAFLDPRVVFIDDLKHSANEKRYFALGFVDGDVLTVRFTLRGRVIRIFGAGYWRQGTKQYEEKNHIHRS